MSLQLNAGDLSMLYESPSLRYIRLGDIELVRQISFPVRDCDWGTVPFRLSHQDIRVSNEKFHIRCQGSSNAENIRMDWDLSIRGYPGREFPYQHLSFSVTGIPAEDFYTNRTGICVLHPISECRSKNCRITHPDGSVSTLPFPDSISPHQPFLNIRSMSWEAAPNCKVSLHFSGEVFETEDQRNWTDHSFKTYCTPLDNPYPVLLSKGSLIRQSVSLYCQYTPRRFFQLPGPSHCRVRFASTKTPIPQNGLCRPAVLKKGWPDPLHKLKGVGFRHYRVELYMKSENWRQELTRALEESILLNAGIELVLFFSSQHEEEALQLVTHLDLVTHTESGPPMQPSILNQILLLDENAKTTSDALLANVLPILRDRFPGIPIGAGTNAYFAELNRSSIDASQLDFLSFSIHPQVHAFDDKTLLENMQAQSDVILSAKKRFPGKAIHVSPVTLRARFNPDARPSPTLPGTADTPADPRHPLAFAAAWTLGSFKYLAEAGASAITWYEAAGPKGLLDYDEKAHFTAYPLLPIFELLLDPTYNEIIKSDCDKPLELTSLILSGANGAVLLLANHTDQELHFVVEYDNNAIETPEKSYTFPLNGRLRAGEIKIIPGSPPDT